MRLLKLKVYFKSGAHPWTFERVTNMTTEGALLRLTMEHRGNEWYPLCEVFRIVEEGREEVEYKPKEV